MKKYIVFLVLFAVIYFLTWAFLSLPYRPIPALERGHFVSSGFSDVRSMLKEIACHHLPMLPISLIVSKIMLYVFTKNPLSLLLLHSLISNCIILFLVGIFIFMITRSRLAAFVGLLLYSTSAWPANYYFFWTYAPFAAMLALSALVCMLKASVSREKSHMFIVLSGIFSGLYFWSSACSVIMVGLYSLLLLYLFRPVVKKINKEIILAFILSFIFVISPFLITAGPSYIRHILENIESYNSISSITNVECLRFPFFSFFYMLGTYNPFLLASFLIVLLSFVSATIRKRLALNKILLVLIVIFLLHTILIDISPATKLGRAQFVIYPIFIILFVSMGYYLISGAFPRLRSYLHISGCLLAVLIILFNIKLCSEMVYIKQATPRYLNAHLGNVQLYVLDEGTEGGSHADYIITWLEGFHIQKIKKDEINSTVNNNKRGALLVGPNGRDSGLSILSNCCLDDFLIDLDDYTALSSLKRITLPYFAYFPPFLFEEETCHALYFYGKRADYRLPSKNIKLLIWNNEKGINN